ncbi:MAG TPA: glycosyltransferase family 4 protein, partial [Thermoanaerobaculia bacterium]|nr:glycosyltransferase family 4 protein [Thermoanaerobaculia bacterium]
FNADATNAGTDGYIAELKSLSVRLGIGDRVVFTGYRSDVQHILPQLTVSVQPSLSEGLSNTVLESMAAGTALVATLVGGTGEVVRDGENGLLVPAEDPRAIATAVERVLGDPDLAVRLGAAAQACIRDHYSVGRMVEQTSDLYEGLR